MSCLRPATPGFVVTLAATILLAIVSFCVPYLKSVFFLRASISQGGVNGSIIFGTLGYCLELSNGTTCSKPSVGYELDINSLVGNELPIQIPQVVVKWITTALVLHIAALIVAAGSALFGLLAHVREMSMTCCSTFISGFAAVIALVAFIFDLILFFVAKARISSIGSAEIGSAVWLTLAAWLLLFFSGCFYSCGRCCISNRAPKKKYNNNDNDRDDYETGVERQSSKKRRLDAVKAEADRKARQKKQFEGGLPEFPEIEPLTAVSDSEPQTGTIHGNEVRIDTPHQNTQRRPSGGYAPAAPGTSTMDDYYRNQNTYPPQRQLSVPSVYSRASSGAPPVTAYHNDVPQVPTQALPYPTAYGSSYGYASPSSPFLMPDPNQNPGPSYFSAAGPGISATGPGQRPDYPQHNIRSSPSPHQDSYNPYSLLDAPPLPSIPPNQPTPNPYIIRPSPPPQQPLHGGYTSGGDDYEVRVPQPPSNPYVIRPSPPPQGSSNYIPRGDDHEVRRSSDDLPPVYSSFNLK